MLSSKFRPMRALIALLLSLWLAPAWAQLPLTGAGKGKPGVTYQGPGDVVSKTNLKFFVGLRALDAADRGSNLINLCNAADAACVDVASDATTGNLVAPTNVGGTDCTAVNTCSIKTWYDRSGALYCSGSTACNFTQATIANRATLTFNCINSKPCAVFSGSQYYLSSATAASLAATMTVSSVTRRTASFTTTHVIFSTQGAAQINVNYRQVANAIQMFAGTAGVFISNITDSNYHAVQAVFNGASSALVCGGSAGTNCSVGGTSNSLSPGATASSGSTTMAMGFSGGTNFLTGEITELFLYNATLSAGDATALNNNQYSYWGPF